MSRQEHDIDIGHALQLAILRPERSQQLTVVQPLPKWWPEALGNRDGNLVTVTSPALLEFMKSSWAIWHRDHDRLEVSAPFDVHSTTQGAMRLQAMAVRQDRSNVLIVRNLNRLVDWLPEGFVTEREQVRKQRENQKKHRRLLADITADRDEARRLEQVKSAFLATMSHEIRNPLTTIMGMTSMARSALSAESERKCLNAIADAANRLLRQCNDILDVSRIHAERMELVAAEFSICELLSDFETEWQMHSAAKGLRFLVEVASDLPSKVVGDSFRLRQILTNLVGNAIKFTERGEVKLVVTLAHGVTGPIRFEIQDTGIGIALGQQDRIFESFTQVDQSSRRRHQGAGLGLAIAANLVRLMGSEIHVQSALGRGCCFRFDVELPPAQASSSFARKCSVDASLQDRSPRHLCVLVAEDHELNRSIIVETLTTNGIQTVEASNGQAAIDAWRENQIDVVLMDCQMPGMSGFDAIEIIRREEAARTHIPIIALTAHALNDDRQRLLEQGADRYLAKPFETSELVQMVFDLTDAV